MKHTIVETERAVDLIRRRGKWKTEQGRDFKNPLPDSESVLDQPALVKKKRTSGIAVVLT